MMALAAGAKRGAKAALAATAPSKRRKPADKAEEPAGAAPAGKAKKNKKKAQEPSGAQPRPGSQHAHTRLSDVALQTTRTVSSRGSRRRPTRGRRRPAATTMKATSTRMPRSTMAARRSRATR
jgi:hypothetical protein